MKRSEALKLIANQLDFLNNYFDGMRSSFTPEEIAKADVILTTLEDMGMKPPGKEYGNVGESQINVYGWDEE
jgi:hypothetical protein